MRLEITCVITLPSGMEVTMTKEEFIKFHDDLTKYYNENYETITKEDSQDV